MIKVFFLLVLLLSHSVFANESYRPLNSQNQSQLFDTDIPNDDSDVALTYVGALVSDDGCVTQQLLQLAGSANGTLAIDVPTDTTLTVPRDSFNLLLGAEGVVAGSLEVAPASFALISKVVTTPSSVVKVLSEPRESLQCLATGFYTSTIGTIDQAWKSGNTYELGLGSSRLLIALVSVGAGVEAGGAVAGPSLAGSRLGSYARNLSATLDEALSAVVAPTLRGTGPVLAFDAAPVFVGAIPVQSVVATSHVAVGGAGGVAAGMGFSLQMTGVATPGSPVRPHRPIYHRREGMSIANAGDTALQPGETSLDNAVIANNGDINLKYDFTIRPTRYDAKMPRDISIHRGDFIFAELKAGPGHVRAHLRLRVAEIIRNENNGTVRVVFEVQERSFRAQLRDFSRLLGDLDQEALLTFYELQQTERYLIQQVLKP